MRLLLTYVLVLFSSMTVFGQQLKSNISDKQFLIGEPVVLTYTIKAKDNDSIGFVQKDDVISARVISENSHLTDEGIDFEVTHPFHDTIIQKGAQKTWIGEYVITAWDSGLYLIPGQSVIINDSMMTFPDVKVMALLVEPQKDVDLYDIRENFAEIPDKPFSLSEFIANNWWWLIPGITIIIAAVVFLRRRKNNQEEVEEDRPMSLKQRTILAIEALEDAKLWERNQLKEHFVELSYILRSYLTSRYNISLLEKTTYEAKILLTQKGLNEETVDVIGKILSQSDMVKFAKSNPDILAILKQSTLAKQIVAETSPLEFDNAE